MFALPLMKIARMGVLTVSIAFMRDSASKFSATPVAGLEATDNSSAAASARVPDAERGRRAMVAYGCGACHEISGIVNAVGRTGPSLQGFGRRTLVAGVLVNTPLNVARWLIDPPAITPGTGMPKLGVDVRTAADMTSYLEQLR
jgi:cytochrome c